MNLTLFGDPQGWNIIYNGSGEEFQLRTHKGSTIFETPNFNKDRGISKIRRIPSWVYKSLKEGKIVDVTDIVISEDYAVFRGKSYEPVKKEYKSLELDRIRFYHSVLREKIYSIRIELFHPVTNKMLELISNSYSDYETIISKDKVDDFEKRNPLPEDRYVIIPGVDQKVIIEKKLDSIDINKGIVTYKFEETVETKAIFFNYSYRYSEDKGLFIDSNPDIYDKEISRRTFYINKRIVKIELSRSYVKTDTYKYESEDGMRMCSDTTSYDVYLYRCILEDGSFELYETKNKLNLI